MSNLEKRMIDIFGVEETRRVKTMGRRAGLIRKTRYESNISMDELATQLCITKMSLGDLKQVK